jgi:large subunit ribosomal protein L9
MQVILLERIEKLGQMGDTVNVKNGFARNYLLPRKKALRATEANRAQFQTRRVDLEAHNLKARDEAQAVADKMDGLSCTLIRQASESGQLYGSVTSRDIAESATAGGFKVERSQVILDRAIKTLGIHAVRTQLHPEVSVTVNVNVARSEEEAEMQKAAEHGDAPVLGGAPEALSEDAAADDVQVEAFFENEAQADADAQLHEADADEDEAAGDETAEASSDEAADDETA